MAIRPFRVFVEVDRPVINVRLTLNIVSISAIWLPNTSLNSVKKTLSTLGEVPYKNAGGTHRKIKDKKNNRKLKTFSDS